MFSSCAVVEATRARSEINRMVKCSVIFRCLSTTLYSRNNNNSNNSINNSRRR